MRRFRFRRFSSRLLLLIAGLLALVQGTVYLIVARANERNARTHIRENLAVGARVFHDTVEQRRDDMARSARLMSSDYAIRQLLLREPLDEATLHSILLSYVNRVRAPVITLFDQSGALLANSSSSLTDDQCDPFRTLIDRALDDDAQEASDFARIEGRLHLLVVVPLYAPYPEIAAWFGLAFPIDDAFARKLKETTLLEVTFIGGTPSAPGEVLATTLHPELARTVTAQLHPAQPDESRLVKLAAESYLTAFQSLPLLDGGRARIALQRSLAAELAPARALEKIMLLVSLAALAVAILAALGVARGLSRPLRQLTAQTRRVGSGDYTARLDLPRADELGQLATAFNDMTAGLAERDRVRDLLDKNVSPEVAAQLLRDGASLGGEEREVTVLFADLRGFTPLSEKLPPRELIGLLNRYLDRMSAEIESHGGVIDKFIGDEIMALFGAPLAASDAADRALRAALAMEHALHELNRELRAEGRPELALGIGINTARVVAGNIGSHRRLNYSVIGDGVNIAARLQALTRTVDYHTNILVSAATLAVARGSYATRALGQVQLKGRREPVEIFTVAGAGPRPG